MKRIALIAVAVLMCSAFVNSTGQKHDTVFKPNPRMVLGSDLQKDSLEMELNQAQADKADAYKKLVITLADGE